MSMFCSESAECGGRKAEVCRTTSHLNTALGSQRGIAMPCTLPTSRRALLTAVIFFLLMALQRPCLTLTDVQLSDVAAACSICV